jgi:hypothetical protein
MPRHRPTRSFAIAVIVGGAMFAPSVVGSVDHPLPSQVVSNYENSYPANIDRDCGFSQPLPADHSSSLWLFCDTAVYRLKSSGRWAMSTFIRGSTAAEAPSTPGEAPLDLSELSTPGTGVPAMPNDDAPEQFLPVPAGLVTPAGAACDSANHAYSASWITGVTQDPVKRSDVLISFNNYCVSGSLEFLAEGFGLAEYDPATNTLDNDVTVFSDASGTSLGPQELLGSPIVSGGYLYLFGSYCAGTYAGTCTPASGDAIYLARVRANPGDWADAAGYQWYTGPSSWTAAPVYANSLIWGATPAQISVNDFSALGHGLVLIEQTNLGGGFIVYEASSPAGTWTELTSGTVPCTSGGDSLCHAIIGHPELSTSSQLLVSYYSPGARPYYYPGARAEGHVLVAAFPW